MIKRLLIVCFFLSFFVQLKAQTYGAYGNEWINYSQQYLKIKIAQNGVYRIDSTSLSTALSAIGVPLSTIDPRHFQIFNKGVQQYIYIKGESDGVFNGTDFIEFYAEHNDGQYDSLLYKNTSFLPNPYYSLINDTATYFLTWNNSSSNSRMFSETDTTFYTGTNHILSNYFTKDAAQDYHSSYFEGETDAVGGTDVRYTKAEGWFDADQNGYGDPLLLGGSVITKSINTNKVYTAGPNASITIVIVGASNDANEPPLNNDHHITITYQGSSSGSILPDPIFKGYVPWKIQYNLAPQFLAHSGSSPVTNFNFTSVPIGVTTDNRTAISYIDLKYPHTSDLEGSTNFLMYVPNAPSGQVKSNYSFTNFVVPSGSVHIYDLSNAKRIPVVQSSGTLKALIPNSPSGNDKKCYIFSDGSIIPVTSLLPITPSGYFTSFLTPVTSAYIIISHKKLWSSALSYQTYRMSANGGSHNVILADIDELYDQFSYGIVKSPLSIRNFSKYLLFVNAANPPQNLFLLGKSINMKQCRNYFTGDYTDFNVDYANDLIPSFGNPSSDILLTAGLTGSNTIAPGIPTGRLAAQTNTMVNDYLQKVQEFELPNQTPSDWKKSILHFGGGATAPEQLACKTFLIKFADTIQNVNFGGNVTSFYKTSSAPIQINTSDTLRNMIDTGVAVMTFFGHASGTGFDQSLDDINTYNPVAGHYPFLLANTCYSGNIHTPYPTTSETFVLTQQKGVIAFVGSVSIGVINPIGHYSGELYSQISRKNYGKSIGSCMQRTIANNFINPTVPSYDTATCFQMTLHGDPSLVISPGSKPDYRITPTDVFFDATSKVDTVIVYVVRTNIGEATNEKSFTSLVRTFPNGTTQQTRLIFNKEPHYKDTLIFKLRIDSLGTSGASGVGLNKFYVTLDRNNTVNELNENNNSTGEVDLIINGGDIVPVYPYEFSIVTTDTVSLKASTADPLAASKRYIFQIDTTDQFNSPFVRHIYITSTGGVVKWNPELNALPMPLPHFTDSTVYYWRVSPDSTSPALGYKWRQSSFQYIHNSSPGWEQAHFFQFKNDGYQYVHYNRPIRKFDFINNLKLLQCVTGQYGYFNYSDVVYKINGDIHYVSGWTVPYSGLTFAIFDPISFNEVQSIDTGSTIGVGPNGNISWGGVGVHEPAFDFYDTTTSYRTTIANFINNTSLIPNGDWVLAYNQGYPSHMNQYELGVRQAFHNRLGSAMMTNAGTTVPAARPYILFTKVGSGQSKEIVGDSINSVITLDTAVATNWTQGYIASPVIGPAKYAHNAWHSFHWRWRTLDGGTTADSIVIRLVKIRYDGVQITDPTIFTKDSLDVMHLSNYVDAETYPYIQLYAYMKDDVLHTPPQLKRWHVNYDQVPECAIDPALGLSYITQSTVQEGDNFTVRIPIQNIGNVSFDTVTIVNDSFLVSQWVVDANGVVHHFPDKVRVDPFKPNQVIMDTVSIRTFDNTVSFRGNNALWIEANPVGKPRSQLEQTHFNNIIRIPFKVQGDKTNPLLDVTFDGVHILNADIVSAKPNILIKLKDENQFLALNDTNAFHIFLQSPGSSTAKRIYFGQIMTFIPAVLPNNSCKINYTPTLQQDGTYQLIVQAKDISNNQSGAIDYKINFDVINKATITEVMNYPNPFSTATHFVFTLTGSQIPSNFKIQIMTITGKVVREIFQDEIGFIHVGRNITDYAWDGRDQYGDKLGNGVYLYRVITKLNGDDIELRETDADQYFKKGWGKMYLMH